MHSCPHTILQAPHTSSLFRLVFLFVDLDLGDLEVVVIRVLHVLRRVVLVLVKDVLFVIDIVA